MAEHIWSVVCGRQLIDPTNGVISMIDVSESLTVPGLDKQIEDAALQGKKGVLVNVPTLLISWWSRSETEEEPELIARVTFSNPSGGASAEQTIEAPWQGNSFLRVVMSFSTLPVSVQGLHWFKVEHLTYTKSRKPRWVQATKIPLSITNA